MVETSFNLFDAAVAIIFLLSTLLAFFRGFVREILSLGAWVGAGLITLYYFPDVLEMISPQVEGAEEASAKDKLGATAIAFIGTYLLSLFSISLLNRFLMSVLKSNKDIGILDNGLGIVFGAFRAGLIVSLAYFVLSFVFPEDNLPPWMAEAATRPYAEKGARMLADVAPDYLSGLPQFGDEAPDGPSFEEQLIDQMLQSPQLDTSGQSGDEQVPNYEYIQTDEFQRLLQQLGDRQRQEQNAQPRVTQPE